MRTTGTSAAPFEARASVLAGPTGRPLRRILPASSSLNLPAGTTLPVPLLPGQDAPTSGLGGSMGGHGTVSALAQNSDPPDAFGQSWLSYLEAPSSQDELKPPTALMSRAEGKKPEANIIRLPAGLLPGTRGGLEYMLEEVLGFVIEESTTPPESPPRGTVQANDTGKGEANTKQPDAASVEAPAPTTTQAASTISHQPHITGLAPYLDPPARRSTLGRLLAQLPSPAIAASAPSTTAPDSTFPDMWAPNRQDTGKASTEVATDGSVQAPAPAAPKRIINEVSKASADTTSKDMTSLQASVGSFKAAVGAVETAIQRTAPANQLNHPATSANTTLSVSTQPGLPPTVIQTAPIQALISGAHTRAAPSRAASTRATSIQAAHTQTAPAGAVPTQAATTRAAPTQATTSQVATAQAAIAQAATTQSPTNAPAATSLAPPAPAATAPAGTTASDATAHATQPAPEPRRSKRKHKGQRTTKQYGY